MLLEMLDMVWNNKHLHVGAAALPAVSRCMLEGWMGGGEAATTLAEGSRNGIALLQQSSGNYERWLLQRLGICSGIRGWYVL